MVASVIAGRLVKIQFRVPKTIPGENSPSRQEGPHRGEKGIRDSQLQVSKEVIAKSPPSSLAELWQTLQTIKLGRASASLRCCSSKLATRGHFAGTAWYTL
jgi:hypothetical protein